MYNLFNQTKRISAYRLPVYLSVLYNDYCKRRYFSAVFLSLSSDYLHRNNFTGNALTVRNVAHFSLNILRKLVRSFYETKNHLIRLSSLLFQHTLNMSASLDFRVHVHCVSSVELCISIIFCIYVL